MNIYKNDVNSLFYYEDLNKQMVDEKILEVVNFFSKEDEDYEYEEYNKLLNSIYNYLMRKNIRDIRLVDFVITNERHKFSKLIYDYEKSEYKYLTIKRRV